MIELAACMEHGEDHFHRAFLAWAVLIDRYAAPIVLDRDRRTALMEGHPDAGGVTIHRLVYRVVEDLPGEVMEAAAADAADVHSGPATNRVEPFENRDVFRCICHLNAVLTLIWD